MFYPSPRSLHFDAPLRDILRLSNGFLRPLFDLEAASRSQSPTVRVRTGADDVTVTLTVPGTDPAELEAVLHERALVLNVLEPVTETEEHAAEKPEEPTVRYSRTISLPFAIDGDAAEATYRHGLLEVKLPRREEVSPRTLSIKTA
jgi:HSP20 family protein